jgi:hypothetical protein
MKTNKEKLQYILKEIDEAVTISDVLGFSFYISKAKRMLKDEYTQRQDELTKVETKFIKSFDFARQVLQRAERLERKALAHKLINTKCLGIEAHAYAPELNKAKFKKNISPETFDIKTPQVTSQAGLLNYLSAFCLTDLNKYLQL